MARRVCAWCDKDMGPAPEAFGQDTHGICLGCEALYFPEKSSTRPSAEENMKEKPAEIVITAPAHWRTDDVIGPIAMAVAFLRGGRVIIKDAGGIVETVDPPGLRGNANPRVVARITLKHSEG